MFERFTDRARKVMALANQEAQRFNHEYVGTEHILLGLVKEASGTGAKLLQAKDIDLRIVRLEVEKLVRSGPDIVTMGVLPKTPRAKRVIDFAIEEARSMGHNYLGTEHLLLGLMLEHDGVAAVVLKNLGVDFEETKKDVRQLLGNNPKAVDEVISQAINMETTSAVAYRCNAKIVIPTLDENQYLKNKFEVSSTAMRELIASLTTHETPEIIARATQVLSDLENLRADVIKDTDKA